ncbi:hypothetical protein C7C46_04195 [Streptomyces tateyamensis]|uniref:Uncharacterized protein n=1 Tax=Streptomyces tateyamensis TaxID=565073 RepID=A0A2V4P9S2_9ACTN|nr:DUF6049 family protein [Streptomyces tateyamensis]PYC87522.1 hypothetical protein C7C46_04195 [Streptomyces tateyamensis]
MGEPARHTEGPGRAYPATRRGRSLVRRLPVLAASALALLGVVTAAVPPAQAAPAFATVSPEYPVAVTIKSVSQSGFGTGDTVQVSGTVTNTGPTALKAPTVGLSFGRGNQQLAYRSSITQLLSRTDPVSSDGTKLQGATRTLGDLPAGGSAAFDPISIPLGDLKLDGNGVYELAVEVQAGTPDDESAHPVGIARTVLPYFPEPNGVQPTKVATLWPLTHAPELVAQSNSDSEDSPVLRDDSLAADLAPAGRLGQLLNLGSDLPSVTWVVDPELLDAVFAMTKPYRVQTPGHGGAPAKDSNTVAGTGQAVATEWLAKLRTAVAKNGAEVVSLPYGDPDLASIAHNANGVAGLETELDRARLEGRLTVEGRLSVDPKDSVGWPYQGALDQPTAQAAQQLGASELLVSSASVPDQLSYTANAARQLSTGQTAVAADSTIANQLQSDLTTADARAQATQRLLAETLAVTLQRTTQQRTLLVMPPRTLTTATAQVLHDALKTAQKAGWTAWAGLDEVARTPADKGAGTSIAEPYPADLRGSELPAATFQSVAAMQHDVELMVRILTVPSRVSAPFGASMARSVSTAWRGDPSGAAGYLANSQAYLTQLKTAVSIPPKSSSLTLAGDSGLIQVSVRNDLHQPVVNLELRLTSSQPNRLRVTSQHSIELPAGQSTSPRFQAQAVGNGTVAMTAQLWTVGPDAQKYGEAVTFNVEVSQVPSGVWWVVGAGALLVLAAGVRFVLARRKHGGQPPEDPDAPLVDPQAPPQADGTEEAGHGAEAAEETPGGVAEPGAPRPDEAAAHP